MFGFSPAPRASAGEATAGTTEATPTASPWRATAESASSREMGSAAIRITGGRRLAAMARAVAREMGWVAGRVAGAEQADEADAAGRAAAEGGALGGVDLAEAGVVAAGAVIL